MGLQNLLKSWETTGFGTSGTSAVPVTFQRKPAPVLAGTPGTSGTWQFERLQEPSTETAPRPDLDRWSWPYGSALNGDEIDTYTARLERFTSRGLTLAKAENLAVTLLWRDRDQDERRLCLECSYLGRAGQCGNWRGAVRKSAAVPVGLVQVLQRCGGFKA